MLCYRKLLAEDIDTIFQIKKAAIAHIAGDYWQDDNEKEKCHQMCIKAENAFLILNQDIPCGFYDYMISNENHMYLHSLFLASAYQRRGIRRFDEDDYRDHMDIVFPPAKP